MLFVRLLFGHDDSHIGIAAAVPFFAPVFSAGWREDFIFSSLAVEKCFVNGLILSPIVSTSLSKFRMKTNDERPLPICVVALNDL